MEKNCLQNLKALMLIVINPKSQKPTQRGSALTITLTATAVLSIAGYFLVSFLNVQRSTREDEIQHIQARGLALDVVEIGKYFLAYEKVVFIDDSLSSNPSRKKSLDSLISQGIGSVEPASDFLSNACGGYDIDAVGIGDFKVKGESVFCPLYLRSPLFDGVMLENLLFRMWANDGDTQLLTVDGTSVVSKGGFKKTAIFKQEKNGSYLLELDLTESVLNPTSSRLRLGVDQNFINTLKASDGEVKLRYQFFTRKAGFDSVSNERFASISAVVKYGPILESKRATASESLILQSPTVKDFALFLIYPETDSGSPTQDLSKAFDFGGSGTQVFGRVFFDGDIDVDISKLPTFHEVVIISGRLRNQAKADPEKIRAMMQEKFRKGLIMNFPTDRLIKDGNCLGDYNTFNQSEMYCKKPDGVTPFGIQDYIHNLVSMCSEFKVIGSSGNFKFDLVNPASPITVEACTDSEPGKVFISGGANNVVLSGTHAFILSPVRKTLASNTMNIYGTILGGHVSVKNNTSFYSISNLREGLVGLADKSVLAEVTTESSGILAGIGVPLINLPLFRSSAVGR